MMYILVFRLSLCATSVWANLCFTHRSTWGWLPRLKPPFILCVRVTLPCIVSSLSSRGSDEGSCGSSRLEERQAFLSLLRRVW